MSEFARDCITRLHEAEISAGPLTPKVVGVSWRLQETEGFAGLWLSILMSEGDEDDRDFI